METILLSDTETDLERAAAWIQAGEVVGMPTGGRCQKSGGSAADLCGKGQTGRQSLDCAYFRDGTTVRTGDRRSRLGISTGRTILARTFNHDFAEAGLYPVCHIRRIGYGWHPDAIPSHRKTADYIV